MSYKREKGEKGQKYRGVTSPGGIIGNCRASNTVLPIGLAGENEGDLLATREEIICGIGPNGLLSFSR